MTNRGQGAEKAEWRRGPKSPGASLGHQFPRQQTRWWRSWASCQAANFCPGGPAGSTKVSARIISLCQHPILEMDSGAYSTIYQPSNSSIHVHLPI